MKYFWILLFIPSILIAETKIIGYEYYAKNDQIATVNDMSIMDGTLSETERYKILTRTLKQGISTTLDTAVKDKKAYKVVVKETKDVRPNGITATFVTKEGEIPADLNYSTEKENQKLIDAEIQRLKALEDKKLEDTAKANLGL